MTSAKTVMTILNWLVYTLGYYILNTYTLIQIIMIIIIIYLQQEVNVNIQLTTITEEIKSNINAVHHCQAQTGYPNCLLYTRIAIGNIPQFS